MFRNRNPHIGARPGTLLIASDASRTRVRLVKYSPDSVTDEEVSDVRDLPCHLSEDQVTWVDVQGFADEEALREIAEQLQIHPLAMEDVINVPQRPKAESYGHQLLIIARPISVSEERGVHATQLGIIVGRQFVITFRDQYSGLLAPVRERINDATSRLRRNGADYLAYAILDTAVDAYFPTLEAIGERLESLERQVISTPHPDLLKQINALKNQLMNLRRSMWPQREAVRMLLSGESELIGERAKTFFHDTYDHCIQTSEVVEMYREMATSLLNTYLSSVAHRSNEIMKVLTVISSIFVPLTFVAGIYGMNFEHMPELGFTWSYPLVWFVMLGTAIGMLTFFTRRGWIRIFRLPGTGRVGILPAPIDSCGDPATPLQTRVLDHDRIIPAEPTFRQPLVPQMRKAS